MSANRLRAWLIGLLAAAAVLSVVGNKTHTAWVGWISLAVFLAAALLYARWRRAASRERRARVFDREAKTDETGPRADQ